MAIKVNLLPREARAARTGRVAASPITTSSAGLSSGLLTKALTGVFVVMALVMAGLGYQAWASKRSLQSEITTLKAQNEQLKGQLNELDQAERAKVEIQRRIEVIGKVAKSQGVPLAMLNQVPANRCEWLVPGLLEEKVTAFLKTVPQKHRHRLQPIGESTRAFLDAVAEGKVERDQPLLQGDEGEQ